PPGSPGYQDGCDVRVIAMVRRVHLARLNHGVVTIEHAQPLSALRDICALRARASHLAKMRAVRGPDVQNLKHLVQTLNANVQHPEHRGAVPSKPARAPGRSKLLTLQ